MQRVRTSWTKLSRGGAAAARRNAAPVALPLPAVPGSFAHLVQMREADGFRLHDAVAGLDAADVQLREEQGSLRVLPSLPLFSAPPRPRRPPAVRLAPGRWLRWQLNFRFSSTAGLRGWSYRQDTFNIAYGPVPPEAFLGPPDFTVDERGSLR